MILAESLRRVQNGAIINDGSILIPDGKPHHFRHLIANSIERDAGRAHRRELKLHTVIYAGVKM